MKRLPLNSSFQVVLVCLVLVLILYNGVLVTISPEFSFTSLLKYIVSRDPYLHKSACPEMCIQPADSMTLVQENTACLPHIQSEKACEYTAKTYAPYPSLLECPELPYELCTILEKKPKFLNQSYTLLKIRCDMSLCDPSKPMYIEAMNPKNGQMIKYDIPLGANDSVVENLVLKYAETSRASDLNFLFLNCTGLFTGVKISQLLTFLPALSHKTEKTAKHKVNVNLVLIDSLSRAHFYRSLPNTIKFLQKINAGQSFPGHIFEYELLQAVHGHTHESEQALFGGRLYSKNLTSKQKSAKPVDLHMLYGVFKKAGYQTMFVEDLCWKAVYGIVTSLKARSWTTLLSKMKGTSIDTRGITEAACKVLKDKGKHMLPFFDNKEHQLCFNGKHTHEYLFEYLIHFLETRKKIPKRKPLFSYTVTHVSHDEIGLRVQSVDKHLQKFIETLSMKNNTISFIFADHGNTYTRYQSKFPEGRQEMYHPMMLVVLPERLAQKFGNDVVRNLQQNQRRLFNVFDLRKSLIALSKYNEKSGLEQAGLFGYISKDRTCKDLAMTEEAVCICRTRKYTKLDEK